MDVTRDAPSGAPPDVTLLPEGSLSEKSIRGRNRFRTPSLVKLLWFSCLLFMAGLLIYASAWAYRVARLDPPGLRPHTDYVGMIDNSRSSISENDRGWPLYREALIATWGGAPSVTKPEQDRVRQRDDALRSGPAHEHWPAARDYLQQNEVAIRHCLEGTRRAEFGFIYRDSQNDHWLTLTGNSASAALFPRGERLEYIVLPHVDAVQSIASYLLRGWTHLAAERRDRTALADCLEGRLRLADQIWRSAEFAMIERIAAQYTFGRPADDICRLVTESPELFDDATLARVSRALRAVAGGSFRPNQKQQSEFALIALGDMYTEDGNGNGFLALRTIDELRWDVEHAWDPALELWRARLAPTDGLPGWRRVYSRMTDVNLCELAIDRKEAFEVANRLLQLRATELDLPPWDRTPSAYKAEVDRLMALPDPNRYVPVLTIMPRFIVSLTRAEIAQLQSKRDSALLVVALARYQLRHDEWPKTLSALVPDFLDSVPIDPADGRPIRYLLRDGLPVIYSVGNNQRDDTADTHKALDVGDLVTPDDEQWLPWREEKPVDQEPVSDF
jgi:hypothetical protein